MASVTIGGRKVTVSDNFKDLSPEEQQKTVQGIADQMGISKPVNAKPEESSLGPDERWSRGTLLPLEVKEKANKETNRWEGTDEWRWAVPEFVNSIWDSVQLPGQVMRGEVNPMSEEGFERGMGLAMTGVSPIKGSGKAVAGKTVGEVISETTENIGKQSTKGTATAKPADFIGDKLPDAAAEELNTLFMQGEKAASEPGYKAARMKAVVQEPTAPGYAPGKITPSKKPLAQATLVGKPVTGTMSAKANTFEFFNELPPNKQAQLRMRQAEKIESTAKGGDAEAFATEVENARTLGGNLQGMTTEMKMAIEGSQNAVGMLEDASQVQRFVDDLDKVEAVAKATKKGEKKVSLGEKIFEVWVNSLLSGPQTHSVNVMSNALVNVWGLAENAVSAAISKGTGSGITFREVGHRMLGNLEATGDALRAAGKAFKTEKELFDTSKIEGQNVKAISGLKGSLIRTPGRLLSAEDAFFKTLGYRQEIDALAVRNAYGEGLRGKQLAQRISDLKANPTDDMLRSAEQYAKKQTFTNELGVAGKAVQRILNEHPSLRVIVPFFRTPVNLIKYSAERTPAALLMKKSRDDLLGRNGKVARDQAYAKVSMGSAIGSYIFYQAAQGNVTGFGPSNENERAIWRRENQPYSIRVGDTWYSYSRLEPLGTILGLAADAQQLHSEGTDKEWDDYVALIASSIAQNASTKTWLKGPIDVAEVLNNPQRFGKRYVQDLLGTVVPTGIAQYARTQDPYLREAEGILDGIKARVKGWRETLAIKRDAFGEPIKSEGGIGPDIVSPIYTQHAKNDPTIAEILKQDAHIGRLEKNIQGVDLTPEEWDAYSQFSGQTVKKLLDTVVKHPNYQKIPDELKKKLLEDIIRNARDISRAAIVQRFPDLMMRIAQSKASKMIGGTRGAPMAQPQVAQPPPGPPGEGPPPPPTKPNGLAPSTVVPPAQVRPLL